ncbi:hypothetical protein DL96DRAFT_1579960 [Flagelloscypha sp. PMI_526]|nr:hypothetical protein DL96DRAFT_1579960 [Flagelloscypha sp. PMI_526]
MKKKRRKLWVQPSVDLRTPLGILKESSHAFPPLLSVTAGLLKVVEAVDRVNGLRKGAKELRRHVEAASNILQGQALPKAQSPDIIPVANRYSRSLEYVNAKILQLTNASWIERSLHLRQREETLSTLVQEFQAANDQLQRDLLVISAVKVVAVHENVLQVQEQCVQLQQTTIKTEQITVQISSEVHELREQILQIQSPTISFEPAILFESTPLLTNDEQNLQAKPIDSLLPASRTCDTGSACAHVPPVRIRCPRPNDANFYQMSTPTTVMKSSSFVQPPLLKSTAEMGEDSRSNNPHSYVSNFVPMTVLRSMLPAPELCSNWRLRRIPSSLSLNFGSFRRSPVSQRASPTVQNSHSVRSFKANHHVGGDLSTCVWPSPFGANIIHPTHHEWMVFVGAAEDRWRPRPIIWPKKPLSFGIEVKNHAAFAAEALAAQTPFR